MTFLRRCAAACLTLGITLATGAAVAVADDVDPAAAGATQINGLAWDSADKELFVLDDKGDVVVLDRAGKKLGTLGHPADIKDAQGLAYHKGYVYIGDIGDPQGNRDQVTVYRMQADPGQQNYRAWDFTYPDGNPDAKAVLVSGKGRIYIITGGSDPGIYRAGLEPSRTSVNRLTRVADAPRGVTDAAFLTDGATMAVRTADGVTLIDAYSWETTATTTYAGSPPEESITPFGSGRVLVGGPAGLRDEAVPKGNTTATPAVATPTPSPSTTPTVAPTATSTASPQATASDTAAPDTPSRISRQGTIMAVAGAVVVAVLAGALVFIARD